MNGFTTNSKNELMSALNSGIHHTHKYVPLPEHPYLLNILHGCLLWKEKIISHDACFSSVYVCGA